MHENFDVEARDLPKVLINAANLHVGGGVQVATSFIQELATRSSEWKSILRISVIASSAVDANLSELQVDTSVFSSYLREDYRFSFTSALLANRHRAFNLVFTVFGPDYGSSPDPFRLVGFAQPWIAYPKNEAFRKLSIYGRIKTRLKYLVQWTYFRRADALVVELDHLRNALANRFDKNAIYVVHNAPSSIYSSPTKWRPVAMPPQPLKLRLGLVSRDYIHKNLDILPRVASILEQRFNFPVEFWVTLNDEEWGARSDEFRSIVRNIGPLSTSQCPTFYEALDGVFFPSLLEASSVSPLEALAMKKPLFASDRHFVRDLCGEYAVYFDPNSAESAARVIYEYYNTERHRYSLDSAAAHANQFSNASNRAIEYLRLFRSILLV